MPLELSKIEELAPDQGSLAAAAKLKKAGAWPLIGCDGAGTIFGECQGSGASPYRVVCSELDYGYKCTCPSRKFPCKHSLALMWMRVDGAVPFAAGPLPDWAADWLARRKPGAAAPKQAKETDKAKASAAEAESTAPEVEDPKAAARAAAQRERNRAEREASIRAGLDELDTWIADALQSGLASFMPAAGERCRKIVRRLVDAKAQGLAGLAERLPADVFAAPEKVRSDRLIERLALLHLIASAYRNQDRLDEMARADIRQVVGWPTTREALLADDGALRVRDRWIVMNTVAEVQADKLRRLETWLRRLGNGPAPQFAVLMDFVPVSLGKTGVTHAIGDVFEAELAYFPSAAPLRALIAVQTGPTATGGRAPRPSDDVAGAVAQMSAALAARPWSADLPFAAHGARVVASGTSLWLTDGAGAISLPLRHDDDDLTLPLIGLTDIDAFGCWDGHSLALGLAETPLGRWTAT
jgi:hypothetical protein